MPGALIRQNLKIGKQKEEARGSGDNEMDKAVEGAEFLLVSPDPLLRGKSRAYRFAFKYHSPFLQRP